MASVSSDRLVLWRLENSSAAGRGAGRYREVARAAFPLKSASTPTALRWLRDKETLAVLGELTEYSLPLVRATPSTYERLADAENVR